MSHFFTGLAAATCLAAVHSASIAQGPTPLETQGVGSSAQGAELCCQQLRQFAKLALPLAKTELKLDENSPVHDFGQGSQSFVLLELPTYKQTYAVNVTNLPQSPGTFNGSEYTHIAMHIETLDAEFSPVRVYQHTGMKKRGIGYEKTVFINPPNQNERYLLIYGALNVEPELVTVSRTDVVFVGTGFFIGGTDKPLTLKAASSGVLLVEAKGLLPEKQ
jgi:hypothetical protein